MFDNRLILTPFTWGKNKYESKSKPLYSKTLKTDVTHDTFLDFNRTTLSNPQSAKRMELSAVTDQVNNLTDSLDDYYATCVKLNQPATMQGYMSFLNGKMTMLLKSKEGIRRIADGFNSIENRLKDTQNDIIKEPSITEQEKIYKYVYKPLQNEEAVYLSAIKSSNSQMGKYVETIANKNEAIRNSAKTTGQAISNEQTLTVSTNRLRHARIADKAATLRQTAANMALNSVIMFGISTAISAIISVVQSWINHKKDLREAALEAADSLKKENETINDNISKITELREKLADGTATEQEAYDARKQLIDIQSELHDSYSKELEGIDLVNGGLEEQLGLLRKIQAEKAKNYIIENDKAIDNARKELETNKGYSFSLKKSDQDDIETFISLDNYINNYLKKYANEHNDVKLDNNYKHSLLTGTYIDGKMIFAPITEQFKIWQDIYDEIEQYGKENSIDVSSYLSQVSDTINKLNKKHKEDYDLLYSEASINEIQADNSLAEYYNDIADAVEKYNEAIASGETGKAELDNISVLRDKLLNGEIKDQYGSDLQDEVQSYFNDMFDKYIDSINIKNFKTHLGSLNKNEAESFTKAFDTMTDIDVKNIPQNTKATKEQLAAYERLKSIADEYDISIENAVDAMTDLKIVTGAVEQNTKNTATAYDTMLEGFSNTQSGIEKFNSAYSKVLTGQDLTADEVNELITLYPALIDQLEKTQNGYTISINKLIAARNQYTSKNLEAEANGINSLQKQINSYNNKLAETQKKHSEFNKQLQIKKQELSTGIRTTDGSNYLNGVWDPLTKSVKEGSNEVTQILYDSYTGYIRKLKDGSIEILGKEYKPLGGRGGKYGDNTGAVFVENLKVLKSEYAEEISNEIASIENGINNCTRTEQEWIERIKESETELQRRKFLYEQTLASQSINWADDLKAVKEAYTNMTSIKETAISEMSSSGFLSSDTLDQIISSTDRWGECLTEVNGKMVFNTDVYQKLIEEESGYDFIVNKARKTQEQFNHSLENKTAALKLLAKQYGAVYDESKSYLENLNAVKAKALETNAGNKDVLQSLTKLGDEWVTLTNSLTDCNSELSIFLNIMKQIAEENQINEMLSDFETSVSKMQHKLQMGKITQNAFNAWYSSEWDKVKSGIEYNSLNNASQDKYNGFEETNYSQQIETQQSLYEKDKQNLDNALEDKIISCKEYCEKWQALNDKYFGKGTLLGNTEDGAKTYTSNNREIAAYSKNTYDDIMSRIDRAIDTGVIDDKLFDDIKAIFGDEIPAEVLSAINEATASGKISYGQSSVIAKYLADGLLSTVPSLADDYIEALDDAAQRKASAYDARIEELNNQREITGMSAEKYWSEVGEAAREYLEGDVRLTKKNETEKRNIQKMRTRKFSMKKSKTLTEKRNSAT